MNACDFNIGLNLSTVLLIDQTTRKYTQTLGFKMLSHRKERSVVPLVRRLARSFSQTENTSYLLRCRCKVGGSNTRGFSFFFPTGRRTKRATLPSTGQKYSLFCLPRVSHTLQ